MLGIGRILRNRTEPEAMHIARVKSDVLSQLQIQSQNGMTVLMEVSGETFLHDRVGEWLISSLTTELQGVEAVSNAVMRQPLGAGPVSCAAFLPHSEHIVDAAWETHDDMLCVPRQLAAVLRISLNEAIGMFDDYLPSGWQGSVSPASTEGAMSSPWSPLVLPLRDNSDGYLRATQQK